MGVKGTEFYHCFPKKYKGPLKCIFLFLTQHFLSLDMQSLHVAGIDHCGWYVWFPITI